MIYMNNFIFKERIKTLDRKHFFMINQLDGQ